MGHSFHTPEISVIRGIISIDPKASDILEAISRRRLWAMKLGGQFRCKNGPCVLVCRPRKWMVHVTIVDVRAVDGVDGRPIDTQIEWDLQSIWGHPINHPDEYFSPSLYFPGA
jgi:hypothetical protein